MHRRPDDEIPRRALLIHRLFVLGSDRPSGALVSVQGRRSGSRRNAASRCGSCSTPPNGTLSTSWRRSLRVRPRGPFTHMKSHAIDAGLLRAGSTNFTASGLKRQENELIVIGYPQPPNGLGSSSKLCGIGRPRYRRSPGRNIPERLRCTGYCTDFHPPPLMRVRVRTR